METNAANAAELIAAVRTANATPNEEHIIHLTGHDKDYRVTQSEAELFGGNAFPIIESIITINGSGRTISRAVNAPEFRFFAINAKGGHSAAKLTLKRLSLVNGDSGTSGGGAIVNDGELTLEKCFLNNNKGTLGGALYNGGGRLCNILSSEFTENQATERGGAVYNTNSSQLFIRESRFYQNYAPDSGALLWIVDQKGIEFQATQVSDGITFEHLNHVDLQITRSSEPMKPWPLEMVFQAEDQAAQIIEEWREPPSEPDGLQLDLSWPDTHAIPPRVEATLKGFEGMDQRTVQQALFKLRSEGQYDILLQLGLGILAQSHPTQHIFTPSSLLFYGILSLLASAPHFPSIDAAFRLFDTLGDGTPQMMALMIASGINAQAADELFTRYGNTASRGGVSNQDSHADVLLVLAQELILRGFNVEAIPSIHTFLTQKHQYISRIANALSWLPLKRLEIENQIRQDEPRFTAGGGMAALIHTTDTSAWPVPKLIDLPPHKEIIDIAERELTRITLEALDQVEARVFRFESALSAENITSDFLRSLHLACLENTRHMQLKTTTPNDVISTLFAVACNGGPYGGGVEPAPARLKAWQSMAGLLGMKQEKSPEQIEEVAKQSHWFTFRAINDWFSNEMIDVGIAVLRADNQTVGVLAGSATD